MRRLALFVALALGTSAFVLPSVLAASGRVTPLRAEVVHGRFFRMPGNDIACEVDSPGAVGPFRGHRTLSCVVFSKSGRRGQRTWGMRTTGTPRVYWVLGNIADTTQTLASGRSWSYGGFRCGSRRAGLTCRNRSDHGFFLNATSQRTF